jgi:hypothetical protein
VKYGTAGSGRDGAAATMKPSSNVTRSLMPE